jgi:hypothetical protein
METERLSSKKTEIQRAENYLAAWRYLKWVQLVIGALLICWGFYAQHISLPSNPELALGVFHPFVLLALGIGTVSEALGEKRARDKRLILELSKDHASEVN